MQLFLADETATLKLGAALAKICPEHHISIHLEGELGAGKTTLARGFLRALGHHGKVNSPTYTLVEHYQINERTIYHFDLYRLQDQQELDYLGLDDFFTSHSICLIEWAENASEYLPSADISVSLSYQKQARQVNIRARSETGRQMCKKLHEQFSL